LFKYEELVHVKTVLYTIIPHLDKIMTLLPTFSLLNTALILQTTLHNFAITAFRAGITYSPLKFLITDMQELSAQPLINYRNRIKGMDEIQDNTTTPTHNQIDESNYYSNYCEILGSHGSNFEAHCLLGCDAI
jgi:hypothetical protein